MKKKHWIVLGLVLMVALNVVVVWKRVTKGRDFGTSRRLEDTQMMSLAVQMPVYTTKSLAGYNYDMIGGLVKRRDWNDQFALAEIQSSLLMELDFLVHSASMMRNLEDSRYYDTNPVDYIEYKDRRVAGSRTAEHHASRLASLGLLTEEQSVYLFHHIFASKNIYATLLLKPVQELLAMTDEQVANLEDRRSSDGILTAYQQEMWDRLAAERTPPAGPPELQSLTSEESRDATDRLVRLSSFFRLMSEKEHDFGISDEQQTILDSLKRVVETSLHWNSLERVGGPFPFNDARNNPADPVRQTIVEIVRNAEQFALLGILTERQATQISTAIATTD